MRFGVQLPLIGFTGSNFTLETLTGVARAARTGGYGAIAANDHLLFSRPWLDGPTALAAVIAESGDLDLMTTVALPAIRGPVALAKTAAALDVLSGGRLLLGVGPGSSARDYAALGLDFAERWRRLDEGVQALRALLTPGAPPFEGRDYSTAGVQLEPPPARPGGIPIWIGSWGSEAGLRRVARLADGWLASAYNTTPALFAEARTTLGAMLERLGRDPSSFPNALATTLFYLTEDEAEAERLLTGVVAPAMNRSPDELRDRILIGTPRQAVDKAGRFRDAGLQTMLVWPVADEVAQVEAFAREVLPHVR